MIEISNDTPIGEVYRATLRGEISYVEVARQSNRLRANAWIEAGPISRPPPTSDAFLHYCQPSLEHRKVTPEGRSTFYRWWNPIHDHFHHGMELVRTLYGAMHPKACGHVPRDPDPTMAQLDMEYAIAIAKVIDASYGKFHLIPTRMKLPYYAGRSLDGVRLLQADNVLDAWRSFSSRLEIG